MQVRFSVAGLNYVRPQWRLAAGYMTIEMQPLPIHESAWPLEQIQERRDGKGGKTNLKPPMTGVLEGVFFADCVDVDACVCVVMRGASSTWKL